MLGGAADRRQQGLGKLPRLSVIQALHEPVAADLRLHQRDDLLDVGNRLVLLVSALERGVHVLLVDLFPPGPHDPGGIHGAILQSLEQSDESDDLPAGRPLTLASYVAGPPVDIYLEHLAVGAPLAEMPLFLRPDRYVNVPLEPTYQAAYRAMPAFWREVLEGRRPLAP